MSAALLTHGIITHSADALEPGRTWIVVEIHWSGVPLDRPHTHSITVSTEKVAQRLVRALAAQAVHSDPRVVTDVAGHSYVQAKCKVMGKYLNADLKRLGY